MTFLKALMLVSWGLSAPAYAAEPFRSISLSYSTQRYAFKSDGAKVLTEKGSLLRDIDCVVHRERGETSGNEGRSIILLNGAKSYFLDPKAKTGISGPNKKKTWRDTEKTFPSKDKGKVLGRQCQIVTSPDGSERIWLWNGIFLKHEIRNKDALVVTEAVNIKENPAFPKNHFDVPSGFRVREAKSRAAS